MAGIFDEQEPAPGSPLHKAIEKQGDELLDPVTLQAAVAVLLRLARKRMKKSDRNEIAAALTQFRNGQYSPGARIRSELADTPLDQEMKRNRPD